MSVQQLKQELSVLSPAEQAEVAAFLFQLRHCTDTDYQATIDRRRNDRDPAHWLKADEFERRLDRAD
jgi:hypothetical protein